MKGGGKVTWAGKPPVYAHSSGRYFLWECGCIELTSELGTFRMWRCKRHRLELFLRTVFNR